MLFGLLLSSPTAAAGPPRVVILDMPVVGQEKGIWCWAAVSEMVIKYQYDRRLEAYDEDLGQCAIVEYTVDPEAGEIDCCKEMLSAQEEELCVKTGVPLYGKAQERLLSEWPWKFPLGFEWHNDQPELACAWDATDERWEKCGTSEEAAVSWEELQSEIDSDRPVVFAWRFEGGGAHVMVATGYVANEDPDAPVRWVVINDPWPPYVGSRYVVPYDIFVSGPFEGYWNHRLQP